jgi:energy-coupling factor transporter ATP-binding protein EcfA2
MLRRIRVGGFKSLLDVDVELGVVNVFIGANGSGKSNLLEALGVLGATVYGSVEPETLRYRGVRLGIPPSYKTSLKGQPSRRLVLSAEGTTGPANAGGWARYYVEFENLLLHPRLKWRIEQEELWVDGRQLLSRDPRECLLHVRDLRPQSVKIADDESAAALAVRIQPEDVSGARTLLAELEGFAFYSPMTSVLRGVSEDIAREPLGLAGSGLSRAVDEMLDREKETLGPFHLDDVWELIE